MGFEEHCRGCQILVVEDEYYIADDIVRALRNAGAEAIGPTSRVGDTLRLIDATSVINGAILDISLFNGDQVYPVAEALRKRGVPFGFATGYDARAVLDDFRNAPRWEKPYNIHAMVREILDLAQPC